LQAKYSNVHIKKIVNSEFEQDKALTSKDEDVEEETHEVHMARK
jgi:hypothetical protein